MEDYKIEEKKITTISKNGCNLAQIDVDYLNQEINVYFYKHLNITLSKKVRDIFSDEIDKLEKMRNIQAEEITK